MAPSNSDQPVSAHLQQTVDVDLVAKVARRPAIEDEDGLAGRGPGRFGEQRQERVRVDLERVLASTRLGVRAGHQRGASSFLSRWTSAASSWITCSFSTSCFN